MEQKLTFENAQLVFLNFSGRQTTYNPEGARNFGIRLSVKEFRELKEDGWNVRTYISPRAKEGDEPLLYLPVKVSFSNPRHQPTIMLLTGKNRVRLTESTVSEIDSADIVNVDVSVRPYNWTVNDKTGVKAYLKSIFVTIDTDDFGGRYTTYNEDGA